MTRVMQLQLAGELSEIVQSGQYQGNEAGILYALIGALHGDNKHGIQIMANTAAAVARAGIEAIMGANQ